MKKILLVCADNAKEASFAFQCKDALHRLRYGVTIFNYRMFQFHRTIPTTKLLNKLLLQKIKSLHPDFVVVIKGEALLPGTMTAVRQGGAKTANWVLDEPFGKYGMINKVQNLDEYDAVFIFEHSYFGALRKGGVKYVYLLPVGADPNLHKEIVPISKRQYLTDVCFIGSHHPTRERLFQHLVDYDFRIYGYRWRDVSSRSKLYSHVQHRVFKANKKKKDCLEMCRHFNLSKINLNLHHPQAKEGGANLRIFECLATNSFLLSDYKPGLEKLFKLNKELVCYTNIADLRRKIDYYLEHETERNKIAKAGQKRVLKEHKIIDRMRELMKTMKRF